MVLWSEPGNERIDGAADEDDGLHGKNNESFSRIYVPNHFKARVLTFIALLWAFVAIAGLSLSVGPLVLGRWIARALRGPDQTVHDLYAYTIGLHTLGATIYATYTISSQWGSSICNVYSMPSGEGERVSPPVLRYGNATEHREDGGVPGQSSHFF